jgi:hypothetical protein
MTPGRVSENGNLFAANGFGNLAGSENGAHCYEEGSVRGALVILMNQNDPQFSARTRLTGSGRFPFEALISKG